MKIMLGLCLACSLDWSELRGGDPSEQAGQIAKIENAAKTTDLQEARSRLLFVIIARIVTEFWGSLQSINQRANHLTCSSARSRFTIQPVATPSPKARPR